MTLRISCLFSPVYGIPGNISWTWVTTLRESGPHLFGWWILDNYVLSMGTYSQGAKTTSPLLVRILVSKFRLQETIYTTPESCLLCYFFSRSLSLEYIYLSRHRSLFYGSSFPGSSRTLPKAQNSCVSPLVGFQVSMFWVGTTSFLATNSHIFCFLDSRSLDYKNCYMLLGH